MKYDLVVIGGGAAGFFGAIQAAALNPELRILILEKSPKLLSKVRISGGGRCNVTHNCFNPFELSRHYPRGERLLKTLFKEFNAQDVVNWFAEKGVLLKSEQDGRMFPVSDSSITIIDCFLREASHHKIRIETKQGVTGVRLEEGDFRIQTDGEKIYQGKAILVATGGNGNPQAYRWITNLGHTIVKPIPSLFTFNDPAKKFKDLMGISVPDAVVRIVGTKLFERGPVLITHWGLSGPAVIKLSAWAAEYLYAVDYIFDVQVSWIGSVKEEEIRAKLQLHKATSGKQKIHTNPMYSVPQRLWQRLCELSEIEESRIWSEIGQKQLNRLIEHLIRCPFQIKGKTTFKEEFVTCGGVDLKEIDPETMESRVVKNLYFAGEVLNIDGETGGFNFQAAWSTAYIAARSFRQL